ncbi:hypothetical protein [Microbacterium sp. BK668]|uniref:hypothetical protein n=1 Tax=Microbacterium sp. BK668 TaxID=2512118 RepID=UPI00105E1A77|nr:hypothetical protein [Microbacterium sp. BK668]TDN90902.1 hypothetical protein EV279_0395 [Microbacterium sp. BK668]
MRSRHGYLATLVRSARPAPRSAVHAVTQPGWGPTPPAEVLDDVETAPAALSAPRPPARAALPAASAPPPPPAPVHEQATDASTPPAIEVPGHPEPSPRGSTVVPRPAPVSSAPPAPVERRATARDTDAAGPPASPEPSRPAARPAAEFPAPPRAAAPRLPAGTEVALERLEHLARRFSAALPAETERPAPVVERTHDAEPPAPRPVPPPLTAIGIAEPVAEPVAAAPREPEPARVEIGSIEVFVTQPAAPAPAAASVAPSPLAPAAPGRPERLSRPAQPFGFGQG